MVMGVISISLAILGLGLLLGIIYIWKKYLSLILFSLFILFGLVILPLIEFPKIYSIEKLQIFLGEIGIFIFLFIFGIMIGIGLSKLCLQKKNEED